MPSKIRRARKEKIMIPLFRVSAFSAALAATLAAPPLMAQESDRAEAANRISVAVTQEMLMQRMARDLCFAELGIEREANLESLEKARVDYRAAHTALKDGDADMGLAPITNPEIEEIWQDIDGKWQRLDEAYNELLAAEEVERQQFDSVVRNTAQLFKVSEGFIEVLREDMIVTREAIDGASVAGIVNYTRQRMLAEKMAKEACLLVRGDWGDGPRFELQVSQTEFNDKMNVFLRGNPLAGIPAPATPEIAEKLDASLEDWAPLRPLMISAAEGNGITADQLGEISGNLEKFLVDMDDVSHMYVDRVSSGG